MTTRSVALGVVAMLAVASCSTAAGDKAGGTEETVTLRFANPYSGLHYTPQVQAYVDAVENVSNGAIKLEGLDEWRGFAPGFEQATISDVAEGSVDLAWVGTRAFDLVDATAFQALTAPMLVDSYALQEAISASDLPSRMLAELDVDGVQGLALFAGGLRKPFSVDEPWVSLANFQGKSFASSSSRLAAAATEALGATQAQDPHAGLDQGLEAGTIDGFEKQLSTVAINNTQRLAPYVVANVNLWPETIAIIANAEMLGSLSEQQRAWLSEAGKQATSRAVGVLPKDADELAKLCSSGLRAGQASAAQLTELRTAFDELYASLRKDSATADFIDRIEDLKARTKAAYTLDVPQECTGEAPRSSAAPATAAPTWAAPSDETRALEGVYRWTLTGQDAAAAKFPEDPKYPWPHVLTMTLKDGRWSHHVRDAKQEADYGGGPYTVEGEVLSLTWDGGYTMSFSFRADDAGNLTLERGPGANWEDSFVIASQQWVRVG